jgi:hypothetical protein
MSIHPSRPDTLASQGEERYPEVEFVCVNSEHEAATPLPAQEALYRALEAIPGVFVYRQDFTDERHQQVMMAAVLMDPADEPAVLAAAAAHGVEIDLRGEVVHGETALERLRSQVELGTLPHYMPAPPCKPSPKPHPAPSARRGRR